MRPLLAAVFCLVLLGGCLPEIPAKPQFGTSGLEPTGEIPPEFAAFNNYGPGTNRLLTQQMCATPYVPETVKTAPAVPGELVTASGRCQLYMGPFFTPAPGYDYR
jgi:hypothetical protein